MHLRITGLAALTLFAASAASADVLWDQSNFDPFGGGFFNADTGDPPFGLQIHTVSDITVGGAGWLVQSISTYYSALDPGFGDGIIEAYVHVFDKVGALPIDGTDDPAASMLMPATGTLVGDHIVVNVSGLSINLDPGEYWIGITPKAVSGPFGPEIHLGDLDAVIGDPSPSYDVFGFPVPAWAVFNPVDATITIEGIEMMPTPVEVSSWGGIKDLYR